MSQSAIPIRQPDFPGDVEPRRIFTGRTGMGNELVVDEVGVWLDIRYIANDGVVTGFSLNQKYAAELCEALVHVVAQRSQERR